MFQNTHQLIFWHGVMSFELIISCLPDDSSKIRHRVIGFVTVKDDAEKAMLLGDTSLYLPMETIDYQCNYLYLYIIHHK